ncbi:MAG: hypothetical protein EOP07_07610 [Proteobacteria bacterium]|nr:MAG: hypothetical protein EOP07_07610 [Pseudomonadota bacterium]
MNSMKPLLAVTSALLFMQSHAYGADKCKAWSWAKGERAKAQFALASQVCLKATRPSSDVVSSVKAVAGANGYLLNVSVPLLTGDAALSSPSEDAIDASANLFVLGQKVWSPSVSQKTPNYAKTFSVPALDKEIPYSVALGPVTVNLQAGVRGEAGVDVAAAATLAQVNGSLKPHVDTSAYALIQAEVLIVKAGIQGNLTFAKGEGNLEGTTKIIEKESGIYLAGALKADYSINLLKGAVKVFADPMAAGTIDENSAHVWESILYSYDGFTYGGPIFDLPIPETLVFN